RSPPTRYRSRWRRDPKPNSHSGSKQAVGHHREGRPRAAEPLIIKNAGQVVFVSVAEIDWIEAANYYTCLHVGPNTHVLPRSLGARVAIGAVLSHTPLHDRQRGADPQPGAHG